MSARILNYAPTLPAVAIFAAKAKMCQTTRGELRKKELQDWRGRRGELGPEI